MATSELMLDMVKGRREYFVHKVKLPIVKGLTDLACKRGWLPHIISFISILRCLWKYPNPTRENIKRPNALVLLEIWEKFMSLDTMYGRWPLWEVLKRVSVDQVEHSNNYSQRMDWFVEELVKAYQDGRWQPSHPWCPMTDWKDPATQEALVKARLEVVRAKLLNPDARTDEILAKRKELP